jgi:hypothetical protein
MLAKISAKQRMFYAPGESIHEIRALFIVVDKGFVAVDTNVLTLNDSWGHDFILENSALRRSCRAVALSYCEVETLTYKNLESIFDLQQNAVRFKLRAAMLHFSFLIILFSAENDWSR